MKHFLTLHDPLSLQLHYMTYNDFLGTDLGEIDDKGKIMEETALAKLPPHIKADKAKTILDECAKTEGKDKCETSFNQVKCVSLKILEVGKDLVDESKLPKE